MSTLDELRGHLCDDDIPSDFTDRDRAGLVRLYLLEIVELERDRQDATWGANRVMAAGTWSLILGEEVGEVNRGVLQQDASNVVDELIQVMAVAAAWIEAIAVGNDGLSFDGSSK